jgi:PAS domain S-box-containing protein
MPRNLLKENFSRPGFKGFLFALIFTGMAWALRQSLSEELNGLQPFAAFSLAVALACWVGGTSSGIWVALLGLGLGWFYFLEPADSFVIPGMAGLAPILSHTVLSGIIILLFHGVRSTTKALQKSNERFQLVSSITNDAIWDWDLESNQVWWSEGMEKLFGFSAGEIHPTIEGWHEKIHPEDRQRVIERINEVIQGGGKHWSDEYRYRCADSSYLSVSDRGLVLRDKAGKPVRMLGGMTDISARIAAKAALERKSRGLQLLADAAAQLLSADSPEKIVRELFHRLAPELELDLYFNFMVDEQGQGLVLDSCEGVSAEKALELSRLAFGEAVCGTVAQERRPWTVSRVQQSNDPKLSVIRSLGVQAYSCNPLIAADRLSGTLSFGARSREAFKEEEIEYLGAICNFIALAQERAFHRRNLENRVAERTTRLQEAVAELEHFSYTITHDMRAPLRAMRGFGEILIEEAQDALKPEHQEGLRRIMAAAARMDLLIQDALSYSKVVREELVLHPVDTLGLLRELIHSYPGFQPPKAQVHLDSSLPPVLGNEAGLTQCFSNLLSNAVKFVQQGQLPRVVISWEARGEHVRLWFEDNGIGIPLEYQERIFGMFQRLSKDFEGTGIGLALVRKVVDRMLGRVGVESAPGQGSRFWVELKNCEYCGGENETGASALRGR